MQRGTHRVSPSALARDRTRLKPIRELAGEWHSRVQFRCANGRAHPPWFLAGRQPSMQLRPQFLPRRELSLLAGDAVDVAFDKRPNRIVLGNQRRNEVLKLARRGVVRHQPNANTGLAVDDCAAVRRLFGELDVRAAQSMAKWPASELQGRRWRPSRYRERSVRAAGGARASGGSCSARGCSRPRSRAACGDVGLHLAQQRRISIDGRKWVDWGPTPCQWTTSLRHEEARAHAAPAPAGL